MVSTKSKLPICGFQVECTKKGAPPIKIEKRNKGKKVTVITNVNGDNRKLVTHLKTILGVGGTTQGNTTVEIQGDHIDQVVVELKRLHAIKGMKTTDDSDDTSSTDKRGKKKKTEEVTTVSTHTGYEDFLKETSRGKSRKVEDYNYDALPMPESCKKLHGLDWIYCTRDCHDVDLSDVFDDYDHFYNTEEGNGHHEDEVTTPTAAATVSSSRMTDNELDKAYHNLGMAAETGPAIFDFDEEKVKRQEKLIEQQEELRKNNLIAREARLAEIEEEDRVHKERMRWEQKEREKRILARYELEQKRKAQWRKTIEKSAGAKELAARQVHFRWRRQFDFDPTKVQTVESGRKGRVMVVLDKTSDDPTRDGTGDKLTPESLEALFEFVSMFEGVECVTELSNAVVATFRTSEQAQQCILVSQDNADIQVTRAATAAVTQGLNVRKVNPMVAAERYGEVVKMNEKARRTAQEREIFNTLCEDNRALLHDLGLTSESPVLASTFFSFLDAMDDDVITPSSYKEVFKEALQTASSLDNTNGMLNTTSSSSSSNVIPTSSSSPLYYRDKKSVAQAKPSQDTAEGTIDFSGYQLMIPAGIKDELVYAGSNDGVDYNNTNSRGTGEGRALIMMMLGLWNNAKYWSKFGEMLDIGLPVEDSHQMAKEYIDTLNNPRRHRYLPGELEEGGGGASSTSVEVGDCPVCGKTGIPLPDLQRHVNDCLTS